MKKKIFIFLIIILSAVGFAAAKEAMAGALDNVWGWAWSNMDDPATPQDERTIGWISFNSENCISNPNGLTNLAQCSGGPGNYGVNIDSSGNFSGYAYFDINDPNTGVEEIGWIDFAPAGAYPTCSVATCPAGSPNYSARADLSCPGNKCWVTGWARACNVFQTGCSGALKADAERGGWDGWILLGPIVNGGTDYGVYIDKSTSPYQFHGWTWGSDVIGWVSFNRSNTGAAVDYKVMTSLTINNAPTASGLAAVPGNYCGCGDPPTPPCSGSASSPPIYLNWTYSDPNDVPVGTDPQSAYQIEIHNNSTYTSLVADTGKVLNSGGENVPLGLVFGIQYWWRLKVWDSQDVQSNDWIYPAISSFTTDSRWPGTDFTFSPLNPPAGVEVTFTDGSTCYIGAADCSGATYLWDFGDGTPAVNRPPGDTTYTYSLIGDKIVRLDVTDNGKMCSGARSLTAILPLPKWREIVPF